MAGVSDDCFAAGAASMTVAEAVARIGEGVSCVAEVETVPLFEADGRVAAEDVLAGDDLPPFDNAAVDGYALRFDDLAADGETMLERGGRVAAGDGPGAVAPGTAARIFTGAPIPDGCDTVVMQEDIRVEGTRIVVPAGLRKGANRRRAGEDARKGQPIITAGERLLPQHLGLAAATGHRALRVRRRLRVALFSTGNELTDGATLQPGAIHDSNRAMLAALLTRCGAGIRDLGILRDDPSALRQALIEAATAHDLVLTSGGVSVGEEDHVKTAVAAAGRLDLWRLAIKPGRPLAMGRIGGTAFVGLPGNPVAAFVTMLFVVRPLLARLGGEAYRPPAAQSVPAAFGYRKKPGRREFIRIHLRPDASGRLWAEKCARDGAAMLSSLTETDGIAALPEDLTEIVEGETIAFHPYATLW